MKEYRYHRSLKRTLYSPVVMVLLVIVLFFLVRAAIGAYMSEQRSLVELKSAQNQTTELSEREDFLENRVQALTSERGLEEELRNKFPVVKSGEEMVIIVEPQGESETSGTSKEGVWRRIFDFFR